VRDSSLLPDQVRHMVQNDSYLGMFVNSLYQWWVETHPTTIE